MESIEIKAQGKRVYAIGNTYPIKDSLRGMGAKWDADAKAWWVGATKRAELESLLSTASTSTPAQDALPPLTGKIVPVTGNTYPVRDRLRALGASWDAAAKVWMIDESRLAQAQAVVAQGSSEARKPFRPASCKQCGARPNVRGWPRIYRNGVCSDCYRDAMDEDW